MSRILVCALLGLLIAAGGAQAQSQQPVDQSGRSQINPNFVRSGEYPFINLLKSAPAWSYGDQTGNPGPDELDENGYPLYGANAFSHGGVYAPTGTPSQAVRPGHYVLIWVGGGSLMARQTSFGKGKIGNVNCTGDYAAGPIGVCDNSRCSALTGSISGTTLTVTTASSCRLTVGQPISGPGIVVSRFGVPTIITGFQTGTGGVGTYRVNFAQTVPSQTIQPGGRYEFSVSGEITANDAQWTQWLIHVKSTGSAANPKNTVRHLAFFHADDEHTYWTGQIFGTRFKKLLAEANFGVIRDLNWSKSNTSNCTTWATRKPSAYWSYFAPEMRKSLYGGVPRHTLSTISFTGSLAPLSASSSTLKVTAVSQGTLRVGQYLDGNPGIPLDSLTYITQQLSGEPGGVGEYVVHNSLEVPSQRMSVTSNDFAIDRDSGPPADKETVIVRWGHTTAYTTTFSADNGVTVKPVLNSAGVPNLYNPRYAGTPTKNFITTLVYDATLGGWLKWGFIKTQSNEGLDCGVPPEVFVQLNAELGTNPWITEYYLAADPITDFSREYAKYIKNNFPNMVPQFETPNELWNNRVQPTIYARMKMQAYAALDPAWHPEPFSDDWLGKVASLLCQTISAVYEGDRSRYKCIAGTNTNGEGSDPSSANPRLLSTSYVKQDPAKIPIQPGYTQTPAADWVTDVAVHTYWNLGESGWQREIATAYNYFHGSAAEQSAIMEAYQATTLNPYARNTIANNQVLWKRWHSWAVGCAGRGQPCGIKGLVAYEGGYGIELAPADLTTTISGARNGNPCVLVTAASFTGVIGEEGHFSERKAGNVLSVKDDPVGGKVELGATVKGPGVANGTVIEGYLNARGRKGTYYVNKRQFAEPNTMTAAANGAVAGMAVTISNAKGGRWPSINGTSYTIQPDGLSEETIPIDLDCSNLGRLESATLTYTGSKNYVNFLRLMSYAAPQQEAYTMLSNDSFLAAGGKAPSQFTIANGGITPRAAWGVFIPDIYGRFPVASSAEATISGTTLRLGGATTGLFQAGQTIIGNGVTPNSEVVKVLRGNGSNPGDLIQLSRPSAVGKGTRIIGTVVGPFPSWSGIVKWNKKRSSLERRPAGADNN